MRSIDAMEDNVVRYVGGPLVIDDIVRDIQIVSVSFHLAWLSPD